MVDERINILWPDARLSKNERALLSYLFRNPGRWVPADELLVEVWNYRDGVKTRTVLTTIGRIRKKIEESPSVPRTLLNLRGHGYRLALTREQAAVTPSGPVIDPDLYGRESEIAALESAFAEGRLITLLGPPGVGKTTLALAWLACRQQEGWHGHFVDVTAANTLGQLLATLAQALTMPASTRPLGALRAHLAGRDDVVLVIDNVEQLTGECGPILAELAEQTDTHVVLTSRRRLAVSAEHVVDVRPWSPDDAAAFLARRVHTLRGRPCTDDELAAVREVVALVDGLPLGLELAAARSRMMPLPYLATRLKADVGVLSQNASDPVHTRSLADSIAWSWGLLNNSERAGLAQLSVFPGGVDIEDAEALVGGGLDVLDALVDHSLVRTIGHSTRLRVLESVRQFVLQHDIDTVPDAQHKQAEWAMDRIRALGQSDDEVMDFARRERDNLLAAADSLASVHNPSLLPMLGVLESLFDATGEPEDLGARLRSARTALPLTGEQTAQVCLWLATVLSAQAAPNAALAEVDAGLARVSPDNPTHFDLSVGRTHILLNLERFEEALTTCQALVARERQCESPRLFIALNQLGRVHHQNKDLDAADRAYSEAVQQHPQPGFEVRLANVWANLGSLRSARGDGPSALACLARGKAIADEHRNDRVSFSMEAIIALTYARMGRLSEADQTYRRLLTSDRLLGGKMTFGSTRSNAGIVAFLVGDAERCVHILEPLLKELSHAELDTEAYVLTACYLLSAWATLDDVVNADLLAARLESTSASWRQRLADQWQLALGLLDLARANRADEVGHHERAAGYRQASQERFDDHSNVTSPLVKVLSDALAAG